MFQGLGCEELGDKTDTDPGEVRKVFTAKRWDVNRSRVLVWALG